MNFDLQMKSQLHREFRTREFSLGRLCFRQLFMTSTNYTDHSLIPISFTPRTSSSCASFFFPSIYPPSPSPSSSRHRSAFSFFLISRELPRRMDRKERIGQKRKFASELNSNYPGVSFARSPRSASSFFFSRALALSLSSSPDHVLRYTLPRYKKRRILGERDESGNQKSERPCRVALMTCTWLRLERLSCCTQSIILYQIGLLIQIQIDNLYTDSIYFNNINQSK